MSEPLPKMICGSFQICGDTTETSSILDLITRDPKCRWARWITPISVILLVVSFLSQLIRLVTVNEPINDFFESLIYSLLYSLPIMSSGYVFYLLDRTKVEHQQRTYVSFECRPHEYFEVQQSIDSREISRLSYDEIDEIHDVEKGLRFSSSKQNLAFELHKSSLSEEDYLIFRNYLHNRVNERN